LIGSSDISATIAGDDLLVVQGISKQFGGTQALDDVGMRLNAGEVVALLGENGAGKSTLIKILAGVHQLDKGSVTFRGTDVTTSLRRLPIAFIHQDLGLIDWMTVAENICLTLGFPRRRGLVDWAAARKRAAAALEALGADIDPDLRIQSLSRTEKSLVAIARALAAEAEILVLDEPTASLPADEVARLFTALRRLRARGVGMLYVSHRLDEVFEIADRMVVLRDGRVAGEHDARRDNIADCRPRAVASLPSSRRASRLAASDAPVGRDRCRGPGRLHDPRRRNRRLRRPARGRPGMPRPGFVRRYAYDEWAHSARWGGNRCDFAAPGDEPRRQSGLRGSYRRVDHAESDGA
jgi:ribose transport system ATP-binding protein